MEAEEGKIGLSVKYNVPESWLKMKPALKKYDNMTGKIIQIRPERSHPGKLFKIKFEDGSVIETNNSFVQSIKENKMKKERVIEIIREEIKKTIREWVTTGNELEILTNAAREINQKYFNNRGDYSEATYQLTVRESEKQILQKLDKQTEVKKQLKGFTAKEDEAKQYYQLPDYNIAISFEGYKVARGTSIQFLNFEGEYPVKRGLT